MWCSLVSCRQIIEGLADTKAYLTIAHLSRSPNPRTFHNTTLKFLKRLHIANKHSTRTR
ncbi:hypothetical protein PVAP13_5NG472086 [Panicum virgatum]|uniref:Uncharacterized protein n=1 Tax=Panicum virgatum TaxID=38727 RepID=A0A8T0S3F5_PANVG|nr:hypothetical protein PVAP13_5NG472086 [Panicum virgatum]